MSDLPSIPGAELIPQGGITITAPPGLKVKITEANDDIDHGRELVRVKPNGKIVFADDLQESEAKEIVLRLCVLLNVTGAYG